jgi:hypothetical protein
MREAGLRLSLEAAVEATGNRTIIQSAIVAAAKLRGRGDRAGILRKIQQYHPGGVAF